MTDALVWRWSDHVAIIVGLADRGFESVMSLAAVLSVGCGELDRSVSVRFQS